MVEHAGLSDVFGAILMTGILLASALLGISVTIAGDICSFLGSNSSRGQ